MPAGALSRYNNGQDHLSTVGVPPSGYSYESTFGSLLTTPEAGTVQLFECQVNWDTFTSPSSTCEGQKVVRSLGWAYSSPPAGVPTVGIYRCVVTKGGDHFDSTDPNCEGQSHDAGLLGYLLFWGRIRGVFLGIVTLSVTLVLERFMAQTAAQTGVHWMREKLAPTARASDGLFGPTAVGEGNPAQTIALLVCPNPKKESISEQSFGTIAKAAGCSGN